MTICILQKALADALARVGSAIPKQSPIPALLHVRIEASADRATFTGCDCDMQISTSCECEGDGLSCAVSFSVLHGLVASFPPAAEFTLSMMKNGHISIVSGKSKFSLPSLPAADCAQLKMGAAEASISTGSASLKRLLDQTLFAVGSQADRPWSHGAFIHTLPSNVLASACFNGPQLAVSTCEIAEGSDDLRLIIPKAAAQEMTRLPKDCDIEISAAAGLVSVRSADYEIISKVIASTFPDYARIIGGESYDVNAVTAVSDLSPAILRVSKVADERNRCLRFDFAADHLKISTDFGGLGIGEDFAPAEVEGPASSAGFAASNLVSGIRALDTEMLQISLSDKLVRLRSASKAPDCAIYVMKMALRSGATLAVAA